MSLAYVYAALLLHEAKKEITGEAICEVLKAAGIEPDPALAKAWASVLKTLNIEELKTRAVAIPMAAAAPAPTTTAAAPETKPAEEKKEEKKEEAEKKAEEEKGGEEESLEGLSALFG